MEIDNCHIDIFEDDTEIDIPLELCREPPRTEIHDIFFESGTRHETVVAYGKEYKKINKEPTCDAKKYKFELDFFQKISICAIERDESVMVSAHTSCGKTVVAEYAIAQSIKNKQRVVYTSPIKALSNQKYRELQEEFQDVGLMTGDVTINPTASCLVMTTEIFRNMLYRGSEVIREVHWVIFDEIHYMKDKERGVVWEETLILLPKHVRMVFLSATIPNALEFAEWICYISENPIHVVYTENRVIPLHHHFYSSKLWLIKDKTFHQNNFLKAVETPIRRSDLGGRLNLLLKSISVPAVIFSFSRKDCEKFATEIDNDFNSVEEKKMVKTIFENAIGSLREEDRKIPIIEKMLPLLERGIGIHHSGLLPIIKEIVEILFQESLIKVLFATETFSIGLNMPAKTVVFTSLMKFDGVKKRLLSSAEYTQMSGRAGRRGLDEEGMAISIVTEKMTGSSVRRLFSVCTDNLCSAFRLTYNMILNLTRVEGLEPTYMLSRSFYHFQAYKNALKKENELFNELGENKKINKSYKNALKKENELFNELGENKKINKCGRHNKTGNNKYIKITGEENEMDIPCSSAVVYEMLNKYATTYEKRNKEIGRNNIKTLNEKGRVIDIMIPRRGAPLVVRNMILKNCKDGILKGWVLTNEEMRYSEYSIDYVSAIYDVRCKMDIKIFDKKFPKLKYEDKYSDEVKEIEKELKELVPGMNLENCLFCGKTSRVCLVECIESATSDVNLNKAVEAIKCDIKNDKIKEEIIKLNKLKEIYHMEECKKMIVVLTKLSYLNETSILIKGKMASEISTSNELVITEMIFGSEFAELPLSDMIALLSCLVCDEKPNDSSVLSKENERLYDLIRISVKKVCGAMRDAGIDVGPDEYLETFSYQMMDIVKMWISGYTFIEICECTTIFEGTIIRTFKRLEELLRQLISAANVIGNNELVDLFGQGIFLIKRDIVFANSLYL